MGVADARVGDAALGHRARRVTPRGAGVYTTPRRYILGGVAKHLVDIDEDALDDAKRELGTSTIKETVNLALRRAGTRKRHDVKRQLDVLARADLAAREQAWR